VLDIPIWVWALTVAGFAAVVSLDVALSVRRPHVPSMREATVWVGVYVGLAAAFAVGLGFVAGWRWTGEFTAGWLTEYSLSVDNLFVFALILTSFGVPPAYRQRVLLVGIVTALVLRAGFIAAGAAALDAFSATFYAFGAVLIVTAVQLLRGGEKEPDPTRNPAYRLVARLVPTTSDYDGARLTTVRDGRRLATPLALVMVAIGLTDVLFALDSIPAIYGLTQEPYLVLTANAFALMGLRQLYFLLAGLLDRLVYLRFGLAAILAFIGGKLVLHAAHESGASVPDIPTWMSLVVIVLILATATVASLRRTRTAATGSPSPGAGGRALPASRSRRR
jgi:tellurite resistance protein TerC